jgi:hypothetical protein
MWAWHTLTYFMRLIPVLMFCCPCIIVYQFYFNRPQHCNWHYTHALYQKAVCVAPPEDEQVMLETCRGTWFSINWMKSASRWFHYTDILLISVFFLFFRIMIMFRLISDYTGGLPSIGLKLTAFGKNRQQFCTVHTNQLSNLQTKQFMNWWTQKKSSIPILVTSIFAFLHTLY